MKQKHLLILLALVPICISAQDIEVEKFEQLDGNQTTVTNFRNDSNGNPCALLIVQSLKDGLKFEGWVVGDVERKDKAYWVFVANGAKHIKIKHADYQTKDIVFSDYAVRALKGGVTYALQLEDDIKDIINKVYLLGWNLNDLEVPNNARSFLKMAATRGDVKAQIAMAQLSLEGHVNVQGGLVNHRGLFWINKLLAAGDSTCLEDMPGELMYAYALQLFGEISSDTSLGRFDAQKERSVCTKISEYLIKACNKGFIQAGNHLFGHYPMSNGLPQYSKDIIRCCEDSSKVGNISAMVCLGNIYEKGIGEMVDLTKAEKWYRRLYEYKSWGSDLCRIYGNKLFPISQKNMIFLQDQADKGDNEALFQLGYMYEEGRNFTLNEEKALQLYNKCGHHKEALYRAAIILCKKKEYEEASKKAIQLLHEERENISNLECLRGILMYNEVDSGLSFFKGSREEGFNILTTLAKQGHKEAKEFIKEIKNQ
jgi:TPR repeat protein